MFRRVMAIVVSGALAFTGAAVGVVPAQAADADPAPPPAARSSIVGTVVDSKGDPLRDVTVYAERPGRLGMAVSAADGRFKIDVPVAGRYALVFEAPNTGWTRLEYDTRVKTPSVAAGETIDVGTIPLKLPATWGTSSIEVKFTNFRGILGGEENSTMVYLKNARGIYVDAYSLYNDIDINRTAYFSDIAAGRYRLVVAETGQSSVVTVGAGEAVKRTVALKKAAKRGNLVVKLGRGVRETWISVENAAGLGVGVLHSSESYPIRDLPAGTYTVTASRKSGDIVKKVKVRAGRTSTVTLPLRSAGSVTGRVKAAKAVYPPQVILKGVGTSRRYEVRASGKTGKFTARQIAPGRYRVIVRDVYRYGERYTSGGSKDAYYKGKTLKKSQIITVKKGKTTRLAAISIR